MKNLDQISFDLLCLGLGLSLGNLIPFKEGVKMAFENDEVQCGHSIEQAQHAFRMGVAVGHALKALGKAEYVR